VFRWAWSHYDTSGTTESLVVGGCATKSYQTRQSIRIGCVCYVGLSSSHIRTFQTLHRHLAPISSGEYCECKTHYIRSLWCNCIYTLSIWTKWRDKWIITKSNNCIYLNDGNFLWLSSIARMHGHHMCETNHIFQRVIAWNGLIWVHNLRIRGNAVRNVHRWHNQPSGLI
jgi:hypothetical protein